MSHLEQLWAGWRQEYIATATAADRHPERDANDGCVFCRIAGSVGASTDNGVVWRGETCLAVLNAYPYASGHLLVLPARHVGDLGGLTAPESTELWRATTEAVAAVERAYQPDGSNVGINLGRAAGAGFPGHLHVHVVPRWSGDTNFMTAVSGVRVIPEPLPVAWEKLFASWPLTGGAHRADDPPPGR
ncbi:MAG: HIT domain-containing protein [Actinomycetota bacterium]|jgi:ATP adenylyltransferase|nr:HIT domain-containing protein [Actinomycetota bacterium]